MTFHSLKSCLDRAQRLAARHPSLVRLAGKVRNQAEAVLGYAACPHPADPEKDGEDTFLRLVGGSVRAFIDVGANVGDWTAFLLSQAPPGARGVLIEPNPEAVADLRRRFSANPGIAIVPQAASDRAGRARFFVEPQSGKRSSLIEGANPVVGSVIDVEMTTIDDVAARHCDGWDRIDFIKIDVEGNDLKALEGARQLLERQAIRFIQFEYNSSWATAGATLNAAIALLLRCGYETRLLTPDGPRPFDYAVFREFFRYANFIAAPAREWQTPASP